MYNGIPIMGKKSVQFGEGMRKLGLISQLGRQAAPPRCHGGVKGPIIIVDKSVIRSLKQLQRLISSIAISKLNLRRQLDGCFSDIVQHIFCTQHW
jgi:hypothetical protein